MTAAGKEYLKCEASWFWKQRY